MKDRTYIAKVADGLWGIWEQDDRGCWWQPSRGNLFPSRRMARAELWARRQNTKHNTDRFTCWDYRGS